MMRHPVGSFGSRTELTKCMKYYNISCYVTIFFLKKGKSIFQLEADTTVRCSRHIHSAGGVCATIDNCAVCTFGDNQHQKRAAAYF